jgi:thioester reductase-like protein
MAPFNHTPSPFVKYKDTPYETGASFNSWPTLHLVTTNVQSSEWTLSLEVSGPKICTHVSSLAVHTSTQNLTETVSEVS